MTSKTSPKTADVGRTYWTAMLLLVLLILVTAVLIVRQTYERHLTYHQLGKLRSAYQVMKAEEQRLMIEQQTSSATPIVAQRAVTELGMFFPNDKQRIVIAPPTPSPSTQEPH